MQNTLSDMARYLRDIIPPTIPDEYSVNQMFRNISSEEDIHKGILAFRDLLYLICDRLMEEGNIYHKTVTKKQDCDFHPSLSVSFPFLNNVKSILYNIGYHGKLLKTGDSILVENIIALKSIISVDDSPRKSKISGPKLIVALKFLTDCGISFNGIDVKGRTSDILKAKSFTISYHENPAMLIGLKVMAIAQKELYSKGNHEIFLRCDYRVLKNEKTESISYLKDLVTPLPKALQNFSVNLHQRYLGAGLICRVDIFYLYIRFIYSFENKEIFTISASPESDCRVLINAQNTHLYTEVISTFPLALQEKIHRGYGCNKKLFGEPCQKGCHGFSFSLEDSILDISRYIEVWLDQEVSSLQSKKNLSNRNIE